jgi:cytochrome P450
MDNYRTTPMMDTRFEHLNKWIPIALGGLVLYVLISHVNERRIAAKLGAKPATNVLTDGFFGFVVWYKLLKLKKEGTLIDFFKNRYFEAPHPEVGTMETRAFGKHVITTKDPENIKAILATQFNDFCLGTRHAQMEPLLGDGIFTLDGEGWKHSRTMLRPQFAREQVGHVKSLEFHVQSLVAHIRASKGASFDIQDLFYKFTVDTSTEFLFGDSVTSLRDESIGYTAKDDEYDGKEEFSEAFNVAQLHTANRILLQGLYWLYNPKEFVRSTKSVHRFAEFYVNKALGLSESELEKVSEGGYIFLYELAKQTKNPRVLKEQLLNIMIAGRDTTASLLSFTLYELARNPEVFKKLQEEIWIKFGKGDEARIEEITFESLKKCEYLKAVINEVLRLYPAVPQNFRVATKHTTLPRGGGPDGLSPVFIRKGEVVSYSIAATHREPQYYGNDADVFRPERWFEPLTKKLGWAFLPFNGGPRICLGQQFALTEASYTVTRLVQIFDKIESFDTIYPPKKASHLTMSLQDGCNISLSESKA